MLGPIFFLVTSSYVKSSIRMLVVPLTALCGVRCMLLCAATSFLVFDCNHPTLPISAPPYVFDFSPSFADCGTCLLRFRFDFLSLPLSLLRRSRCHICYLCWSFSAFLHPIPFSVLEGTFLFSCSPENNSLHEFRGGTNDGVTAPLCGVRSTSIH